MAGMPPILWEQAEGFLVRDAFGNQWIDLTSGIVMANAGHAHPRIVAAIKEQADGKLLHTYAFPSTARLELLGRLVELSPIQESKAILFSSGTEATECAMMLMRRHGRSISSAKTGILSFEQSYHGRTLAASLASGVAQPTDWIDRGRVGHYQIPFPFCPRCPWGLEKYDQCGESCFASCLKRLDQQGVSPDQIAGIIVEPLPGWATWPVPTDFARAMAAWAKHHRILTTFDEIQSGCGRTGAFFGCEHLEVVPDLITLGKGLTSSIPVSAVIGPRWLMDTPVPGEMSSTHGGNPVCVSAAIANLKVIHDEGLIDKSARTGRAVLQELQKLKEQFPTFVKTVHGRGLFISVHLTKPENDEPDVELADGIVLEAVRRGVLMFVTGRGFLKVAPPLCIDPEAALEAITVIRDCFADALADRRHGVASA
jgi:4-aminobutyrate aminotransferase-like enzyme